MNQETTQYSEGQCIEKEKSKGKVRFLYRSMTIASMCLLFVATTCIPSCAAPKLGFENQKLTPCPDSPNCVSSQDSRATHSVPPISIVGDADAFWELAKQTILGWPRTSIVVEKNDYMRFQFVSLVFRFRDDLELLHDRSEGVIHIRSSSRVGRSDFGVNRKRVEKLREKLRLDLLGH